jgi:hypothetical protein
MDIPPTPPRGSGKPRRRRAIWLRRTIGFVFGVGMVGVVVGGIAGYGLWRTATADLPDHAWLADYQPPQMSRIYAADSRLMAEMALERRVFVPIAAIPKRLQQAFVSAEDQNFWTHGGVDPFAIARAAFTNLEAMGTGRRSIGASTITQQVAKNMLVGNDRTMMRKVREAILAQRLESAMSKERILEIYLNEIFLGAQAYGVAAAAMNYFNKGLDELTIGETAFLGALPKAPNNYNPARYPEAAKARRDWVLDRMAEDRAITREEADAAKQEPIQYRGRARPDMVANGQYFTEEVRRELNARFGPEQTTMGGLVVRTSMDPALQLATEKALREHLMAYDRRRGGWRGPVTKVSAAAAEWMPALEGVQRVPGMLPEWRLAVVLEVNNREARLGWVERPGPRDPAQPREGRLAFEDVSGWARPVRDGRMGAAPRRMQDVVNPGDVVMAGAAPNPDGRGRGGRARSLHGPRAGHVGRLQLREVLVQPRHPGDAAARLLLQALRLCHGAGAGHSAKPAAAGRALRVDDAAGPLAPGQLQPQLEWLGDYAHGHREVAEPGDGAAGAGGRHRQGGRYRPPLRRDPEHAARALHVARRRRDDGDEDGRRLRRLRQWRQGCGADADRQRAGPLRACGLALGGAALPGLRRRSLRRAAATGGCAAAGGGPDRGLSDGLAAPGRDDARHGRERGQGAEPPRGRQDGHDERLFR